MRLVYYILFVFLITSCIKTGKEDKHPDVPEFSETLLKEYTFEKVDYYTNFVGSTDNFIFYKHSENDNSTLKIISKKTNKLLKSIDILPGDFNIDKYGNVYFELDDKDKLFVYRAPNFDKKEIPFVELKYPTEDELKIKYANDLKDLDNSQTLRFLEDKKDEYVKQKYFKNIDSIFDLKGYNTFVYKQKDKEFFTTCNFLQRGTFLKTTKKIFQFKEWKNIENRDENTILQKKHLEKFDEVTLKYSLQGSNHIAFGVSSSGIKYYRLNFNNKTIEFKTNGSATEKRDYQGNLILEINQEKYKISK